MIAIDGRLIGNGEPPYIVAEMSANHNGSLARALETITAAKQCGADAIKIQTYTSDTITIDCDSPDFVIKGGIWDGSKLYDLYKRAQTPFEWHKTMFEHAKNVGVTLFSSPFDESAVDLLESLNAPAYKIASFELVDIPLIKRVASTGKPIIMSTGMASENEIEEAVSAARDAGSEDIILLHCISSYPAPVDDANLRHIPELAQRFKVICGLSDHTMGIAVSVASIALGACFIEKHFTLSRADAGPDSSFSIEPADLSRLCIETKDAWRALGTTGFERRHVETDSMAFRRSIYFIRDLPAGAIIEPHDIRSIRPGLGLAPKYYDILIGKRLKKSVTRGAPTQWDIIE